ncbi:MAG: DNA mismatch repair endonuclease MutL [Verrucomicrobiota bacterium]|nr:DNA mismatch repair endonuclease MutL [Limisphaera sp.]MDW8382895.1 DNA mismatch repair endonuclease MutL [Verrucomicrobiota bacterium]
MNRIRLLPETVANQIAAGEVVERPASVVKELVENALDAEARQIVVEIQAGGRSLIRVSDDGMGMSRDDALLSLERHATSKIRSVEDLAAIRTLGFRGEALPSIASVSRFILTTRDRDADAPEGTRIVVSGGRILDVQAASAAPGTCVEVRELFFNVPARRKFLRSDETEAAHVQHVVLLAALAHPEVAFTLINDGRTLWQLPAVACAAQREHRLRALRERWRVLYGEDKSFLDVDWQESWEVAHLEGRPFGQHAPEPGLQIWGLIGIPGVSRATRSDQHLFVNRRPVESRTLNLALIEGYHTALMKGRYPVCCLFLEMDPADVDVNIHPAKREVKFHRESLVRRMVISAVRQTLLMFHATPQVDVPPRLANRQSAGTDPEKEREPGFGCVGAIEQKKPTEPQTSIPDPRACSCSADAVWGAPAERGTLPPVKPGGADSSLAGCVIEAGVTAPAGAQKGPPPSVAPSASGPFLKGTESPPLAHSVTREPGPVSLVDVPLRYLGVLGRLYVLFESDRGLVLMDQHAAHERVLFEEMLDRLEREGQAPSQRLLLPEAIELPARDAAFLRENLDVLARLGISLSEFGLRSFLLDALPPFVKAPDPRQFLLDVLDELKAAGRQMNTMRLGEPVVAKTVCRHAVKARDALGAPEVLGLLEALRRCRMPYTCPHGRPTLIELSYRELERKFGRTG